ncbi:ABC transporter permease subunit [Bifidobacterium cebidarum]|uniref:Amino acid ABC transporter permease n=1 Tax=Bifidobacterium cebidarum TaxID=2650773 RepID=A0A6I1GM78_9BIFI|nr:ABC transporter permease subunit [Bifidobacterium cebidarum]KAB7786538.1 amino acid ABC transporter permease [Bifidobacterium cebidarum]
MEFHWDSFLSALIAGLHAIPQSLIMVIGPFFLCTVIGLAIVALRLFQVPVLPQIIQIVLTVQKGIPLYLFIVFGHVLYMLCFNPVASALHLSVRVGDVNIMYFAVFILSWAFIPMFTEMYWGAVLSVPKGQYEAGYAAGLTRWQVIHRLVLPQMVPAVIPNLTNMLIGLLKASALTYLVGVMDVMNSALQPVMQSYNLVEAYVASALIYWGIALIIEWCMAGCLHVLGRYRA